MNKITIKQKDKNEKETFITTFPPAQPCNDAGTEHGNVCEFVYIRLYYHLEHEKRDFGGRWGDPNYPMWYNLRIGELRLWR